MSQAAPTRLTQWRFRPIEPLGAGATSRVWLAEDLEQGDRVALKVASDAAHAATLAAEAERLLIVDSPALTALRDVGRVPAGVDELETGAAYVALDWVAGGELDVRAQRSASEREVAALIVARDVAAALEELHGAGSAHGDVKPANVVLGEQDAHLIDLGLGDAADRAMPRGGTPRYLAPEVFDAARAGDGRARDLWALGVVLAEIASSVVAASDDPSSAARDADLPAALESLVTTLLAPAPGARPSAAWVRRRALSVLGGGESEDVQRERRKRAVRRAYLGVRRRELLAAARYAHGAVRVEGEPGLWLERASELARRVAALGGQLIDREAPAFLPLDALGRSRWLVALVGPAAAAWPPLDVASDAALAERLLAACEQAEPASFTLPGIEQGRPSAPAPLDAEPVSIALALGDPTVDPAVLDVAEQLVLAGKAPPVLGLALGRALRLRGQLGRALSVLSRVDRPEARLEAAEAARRAGALELTEQLLDAVDETACDAPARARLAATRARMRLDRGQPGEAIELLDTAPPSAATFETRALCELSLGNRDPAERSLARARALADSEEQRARVAAVEGTLAHLGWGDAERELGAFQRAAEHAAHAGAVLEEATYLTGVAAAATNLGELGTALSAAGRATLLFESLGRSAEAARAALARASVFTVAGAVAEAREAAADAIARARGAADARCRAYAHLDLADVLPDDDPEGIEHARRAEALLADTSKDDALRVGARLLRRGQRLDVAALDRSGRDGGVGIDARLEWWGARALVEGRRERPVRADAILAGLEALATERAPIAVRGPALSAGAALAARVGDGDAARRLAQASGAAARELTRRAPPELRAAIAGLGWALSVQSPRQSSIAPEQLTDIETLVRALGRRDRLRPLLDQVLDALVLWTGVERGLLLLRAPGGKLVPRAARNLARSDLEGAQLELSHSLAERALAERETVVAVDAAGEMPEVHASVHALKLRSVLAVPLVARGEALGVVYLDDRVRRGAFGPRELGWVRMVAALAAVAIADARDQLELRRAARRARRAEKRLADTLARREAELDVAERELGRARDARATRFSYDAIVGQSAPLESMLALVDRVSLSEVPVLVIGESGSGKELVARAIHDNGPRAGKAFVTENCGAIPETLLESALFGHVRGAFTGASRPRAGLFEVADKGTLLLDEIGEMSLPMQAKLLRVLQDGEIRPVGSERSRRVDVRVIGATHRDLGALVEEGRFRQDLLYRLDVISVRVPSLRERPGDIALLARHFVNKHAGMRRVRISKGALAALSAYAWPGNVRQLENEMRRALVLADELIEAEHLSPEVLDRGGAEARPDGLNVRQRVDALEAELVRTALERTGGNQTRAAELLGLSRFGLQKMMRRLGIQARALRRRAAALGDSG